jgi:23S rRNA (guanine2535-N1)-methyltransferase
LFYKPPIIIVWEELQPMPYEFATEDLDYSDYAGGRVIYSLPGLPAFPVRLASEMFQRARQHLAPGRVRLYDPTCGGAYHLAALGLLHGAEIDTILASDVDARALELARRNLGLLSREGLEQREVEIRGLLEQYGKPSHSEALESIGRLRARLEETEPVSTRVFQANALDRAALRRELSGEEIQLILCDIPYGQLSEWRPAESQPESGRSSIWQMLDALLSLLPSGAILAIAANKAQKIAHEGYQRVERFQVGKRQVILLTK